MEKGIVVDFMDYIEEGISDIQDAHSANVENIATELEMEINNALVKGGPPGERWEPISDATRKIRKMEGISVSTPLYSTGEMQSHLETVEVDDNVYEVGWFTSEYLTRAAVSIFGTTGGDSFAKAAYIPITNSMKVFMIMEYGVFLSGNELTIPPRPLLRPCAEKLNKKYPGQAEFRLVFSEERLAIRVSGI